MKLCVFWSEKNKSAKKAHKNNDLYRFDSYDQNYDYEIASHGDDTNIAKFPIFRPHEEQYKEKFNMPKLLRRL